VSTCNPRKNNVTETWGHIFTHHQKSEAIQQIVASHIHTHTYTS
jgi:hypothetical protein